MAESVPASMQHTSEVAAELMSKAHEACADDKEQREAALGSSAPAGAPAGGMATPSSAQQQQHQHHQAQQQQRAAHAPGAVEHHRDCVPEGLRHTSEAAADLASRVVDAVRHWGHHEAHGEGSSRAR